MIWGWRSEQAQIGYDEGMNTRMQSVVGGMVAVGLGLVLGGCAAGSPASGRASAVSTPQRLEGDVRVLSEGFALRNADHREVMEAAGEWVAQRLGAMGYTVGRELVKGGDGSETFNMIAELRGTQKPDEIVVIGAHYDAEVHTPGADDNASGVAALLELAARFRDKPLDRTVRWVAFTNEENSSSSGGLMGSFINARNAKDRGDNIVAMLSLEMLGYYSDEEGSQRYPFDAAMAAKLGMELPTVGNFIGVVGRIEDRALVERVGAAMQASGSTPVTQAALPAIVGAIWRSDHGSFWLAGYPAAMVTDTSEYRTPHYHQPSDTFDTLDYERMAGVVDGLEGAVRALGTIGDED